MARTGLALLAALLAVACASAAEPVPGLAGAPPAQDGEAQLPAGWAYAGGGSALDAEVARRMVSTAEEMMKGLCASPAGSALPSCKASEAGGGGTDAATTV
uniref:Uncharacterized protein n=1 Tax=Alexandrium catenella TaxID=2925 RepID=A0A7S1LUZ1_ALECA|mmetsp:Transcript_14215/g.38987  ORF Transcript_14215/g.38987 Transcript_14215/m.38987 type:complete len:101 (+) Transcript_14215:75-377(+)